MTHFDVLHKKIVESLKSPSILSITVLIILYTYWAFFIPTKLFFSNHDLRLGAICVAIYFTIAILGEVFINNQKHHLFLYIITIPASLTSIYFGSLYFFLMFVFDFYLYPRVVFSLLSIVLVTNITYKKILKQGRKQVLFFLITLPVFILAIFNFAVFSPIVWATKGYGEYRYYVIEEIYDYPHSDTSFYKCRKLSFQCDILDGTRFVNPEIIVDEEKKEVSFLDIRGLNYTDGATPRRYTGHEGGKLGDNLFYLSETCNNFNDDGQGNCQSYTLIPYVCGLDNKSCDPLPIIIKGDYEYYFYWEVDEEKKNINLHYSDIDKEYLIFKYGETIQCYVKDCIVLQQN